MAWLPVDFKDGSIEVDVASDLASDAPAYARGFIGVSFRIDSQARFESIYLRPTNSQADDQIRRNHPYNTQVFQISGLTSCVKSHPKNMRLMQISSLGDGYT